MLELSLTAERASSELLEVRPVVSLILKLGVNLLVN